MMPHRQMAPWWYNPASFQSTDTAATFRTPMPGGMWQGTEHRDDGDPRLTPSGDVARRGTIPQYVPFAVLSPKYLTMIPQ